MVKQFPSNQPYANVVDVTPAQAAIWLKSNTHNRSLRKPLIASYARDMLNGTWALNGEAIKFAADGTVLDGQHRLRALVDAGRINPELTIPMLVVYGLANETQMTMDSGAKRTSGDALSLEGHKNATLLSSVLRKVWSWEAGDYRLSNNLVATTSECAKLLADKPQIYRSVQIADRTRSVLRSLRPTITGLTHYVLSEVDREDAVWFFARVADGANLETGHPVLALRNRLTNDAAGNVRAPNHLQAAYVIRAWNGYREGRDMARIVQTAKDPMPMPR